MAMEVPVVIAVPEGEATNIVKAENSGLIVAPESPKKLAEAISKLKSDRDLHQELALNGHLAANKFNRKNLDQNVKALMYCLEKSNGCIRHTTGGH